MLNTLRRRYPLVKVVLAPTPVQGEEAPASIMAALRSLNHLVQPELILLARGGGSIEDLWAFNDERVARAIAASEAPVITGVGHETDFTIADFVADLRAPTPTAAAELATPNQADLRLALLEQERHLAAALGSFLLASQGQLDILQNRLRLLSPLTRIRRDRQRLDDLARRAEVALMHRLAIQRTRLGGLEQRLSSLNPLAILGRGYALVRKTDGRLVRRVGQVSPGEQLQVRVSDGEFAARVQAKNGGQP
jgi:exodeoxyribonuclease VII large subunit